MLAWIIARVSRIRDPRRLWTELRSLRIVPDRRIGGDFPLDPDAINDFFCEVFAHGSSVTELPELSVSSFSDEQFYFAHFIVDCLARRFRFPDSGVAGCDGFSGRFLRSCAAGLFPVLLEVFNLSVRHAFLKLGNRLLLRRFRRRLARRSRLISGRSPFCANSPRCLNVSCGMM